ncbi:sigma-70 family RNA polymerase sigma factor [bacterium]|nr:sigma-70 family RNA polymerase sigma factor [bacterium]
MLLVGVTAVEPMEAQGMPGREQSQTAAADRQSAHSAAATDPLDAREARFMRLVTEQVHQRAWRYCLRLCPRREDSEDLLQESLTQAFRKLDQLREDELVSAWLMSIIRRRYIRHWQREQSRPPQADELPDIATDGNVDPFADQVRAALAQLPQPQRELLELYYIEGLDMQECGTVLGIGPRVVKQRLYRARQAMRRLYSPQLERGSDSRSQGGR